MSAGRDHGEAIPRRNAVWEQHWLASAEQVAGESGFADRAGTRLEIGQDIHGDQWVQLDIADLLPWMRDKAADLGAFGTLALQCLIDMRLDEREEGPLVAKLEQAILEAAYAHRAIVDAQRQLIACRSRPRVPLSVGPHPGGSQ
jgi:hypothetical protein